MGTIYQNATVTAAAVHSRDRSEGCFYGDAGLAYVPLPGQSDGNMQKLTAGSDDTLHVGENMPQVTRAVALSFFMGMKVKGRLFRWNVDGGLVGLDNHVNYLKLALAYHYITGPKQATFLATNINFTLPSAGAGTISAPLIMMLGGTGKEPLSLGKPSQAMMDAIEGKFRFDRKKACMVGDRVNTYITFGIEGGLGGKLTVLTGVAARAEVLEGDVRPMAFVDRLSDFLVGGD